MKRATIRFTHSPALHDSMKNLSSRADLVELICPGKVFHAP